MAADAPHYHYFTRGLAEHINIDHIICTPALHAPSRFQGAHWIDEAAEETVQARGHLDDWPGYEAFAPVTYVQNPNEPAAADALGRPGCDVLVEVGTTILKPHILAIPRVAAFNVHGGNTEDYRGYDSRLWAIYHRDFANVLTTLHLLDAHVDTGPIVSQTAITLTHDTAITDLALLAMDGALDMTVSALLGLQKRGRLTVRDQLRRGRYYTWMPAVLKDEAVRLFDAHSARL